jgi:hypothetical protein
MLVGWLVVLSHWDLANKTLRCSHVITRGRELNNFQKQGLNIEYWNFAADVDYKLGKYINIAVQVPSQNVANIRGGNRPVASNILHLALGLYPRLSGYFPHFLFGPIRISAYQFSSSHFRINYFPFCVACALVEMIRLDSTCSNYDTSIGLWKIEPSSTDLLFCSMKNEGCHSRTC